MTISPFSSTLKLEDTGANHVFGQPQGSSLVFIIVGPDKVVLCSETASYAPLDHCGCQAVLGTADVEIRSVAAVRKPVVSRGARALPGATIRFRQRLRAHTQVFIRSAKVCGISFGSLRAVTSSLANWAIAVTLLFGGALSIRKLGSLLHVCHKLISMRHLFHGAR